jgi:hypothetical protein
MVATQAHPKDLSEWGNFFAGFLSPVAFLWLVLGYMQQGDELKQSTEALRLQAEELKNSVEQQSQLVQVSREQMERERQALTEERDLRREGARPRFVPQSGGMSASGGVLTYHLQLVNVGNTATKVEVSFDSGIGAKYGFPLIESRKSVRIDLTVKALPECVASVAYVDSDGAPGEVQFSLSTAGHQLIIGPVQRVL